MKGSCVAAGFAALLWSAALAQAQCPPSCPIPGGGAADSDCHAEFAATTVRLNHPRFDPANPAPRTELHCFDGDAGCDTDGTADGVCTFDIDVCLHNADPALAACTPATVTAVTFGGTTDPDIAAAQTAVNTLLPASANVCTTGQSLRVPLGSNNGVQQAASKSVTLTATVEGGTDADTLAVTCVPRGWPSHGYNYGNHRATPFETILSPENASTLTVKWHFDVRGPTPAGLHAVTSTPTVGFGFVYVTSWNGMVYALEQETGEVVWMYDTSPGFPIGTQSTATLTADGRLVVGDAEATVHCLDARTGAKLWERALSIPFEGENPTDHNWGSPTVANNRVFVPIASHADLPCTRGRLVALDLDTGEVLWDLPTVPFSICDNDTSQTCETSAECNGGNCVRGRGAGVTATPAVDATGETVYMNTVGCYTFPSIGDSDSMFRIDAATGNVVWKNRVVPPEQFSACEGSGTECRTSADCEGGAPCTTKVFYHDFGFLNGPLVIEADDGQGGTRPLIVSGSKHGTLYAFNPTNGDIVWGNEVVPTPMTPGFAAYGLFNAAIGFANQRIHAALYQMASPVGNPPDHLRAFSVVDGEEVWQDEIGSSWSHVGIANDLLFVGTERNSLRRCSTNLQASCAEDVDCPGGFCVDAGPYYIYDARDGTRLNTLILPANVAGGASIVDGTVYVPYGTFDVDGGVVAYSLPACLGDCNRNGAVTVDELVTGVNIALDAAAINRCFALDSNGDRLIRVNELVGGTGNLLDDCAE